MAPLIVDNLAAVAIAVIGPLVLFAQAVGDGFSTTETLISGSVIAASVSALIYLVRQFAAGNLVSRSSADVEGKLATALDRVTDALERSQERERAYLRLLAPNIVPDEAPKNAPH